MKKSLLLLVLMLLIGARITVNAQSLVIIDDLEYCLDKGTHTAQLSNGRNWKGALSIPSELIFDGETFLVTSFKQKAFQNCTDLTSIIIPEGVTSIGYSCFEGCSSLTSITIPSSIVKVDYGCFSGCNNLKKVIVSDIAAWCRINFCFSDSNPLYFAHHLYSDESTEITDLIIPDVETINSRAFEYCYGLKTVQIPNGVKSIGYNAFRGCSNLTSINIPNSMTSIGEEAFRGCYFTTGFINNSSLTDSLNWGASIFDEETSDGLLIKNGAVCRCRAFATYVAIPNNVTRIAHNAFEGSNLVSVTIPNSVTRIESGAFFDCSNLTSVIIPNSVTRIEDETFANCSNLTSVIIPNSVTCIEDYTFASCSNLTSVTIPNSVTRIESGAFYDCWNLTSITIPEGVDSIGERAFYGCTQLRKVTIPSTVKYLEKGAFGRCSSLKEVYCLAKEVPYKSSLRFSEFIFSTEVARPDMFSSATLFVPAGTINSYKAYEDWSLFGSILPIPTDMQNMSVSRVQNSGCLAETDGVRVAKITLLKEGNILTVNLLNYRSNCATQDFEITPKISEGVNDEPCLVSVGVKPIYEEEADCICPYNISFTIHDLESNNFFLSCWWFKGEVNLTDGEELTLSDDSEDVGIDRIIYRLDKTNLTAMVKYGRSCTGDLVIPERLDYDGQSYLVTSIGQDAFLKCDGLISVTIGSGIKEICCGAFSRTIHLTSFYCYAEKVPVFTRTPGLESFGDYEVTLYVPAQSVDLYKADFNWKRRFDYIKPLPQPVYFSENQMATIILPTAPDPELGKYYRLNRRQNNLIVFEEEHAPKAHVPYIILPKKDFVIDLSTLDLEGCYRDSVFADGITFIGSFVSEEVECAANCYIDIIDLTPDCHEDIFCEKKPIIGALRAFLRVETHWEDPYNAGGTRSIAKQEKLQIVLLDNNDASAINDIQEETINGKPTDGTIYDLTGRKVNCQLSTVNYQLPKGIYIQNGKKILIK